MREEKLKIGILISGTGSNMLAIIMACIRGLIPCEVVCAISNRADAKGLKKASEFGIPPIIISHKDFATREEYDAKLVEALRLYGVELVCLAGFMRIVSNVLLNAFPWAVMNIHPALLPAFPGENAQLQALAYGVKFSGCTVHFVDEDTDTGPIIIQATVPVLEGDTEESLSSRILVEEHKIYSQAIGLFANNRLQLIHSDLCRTRVIVLQEEPFQCGCEGACIA